MHDFCTLAPVDQWNILIGFGAGALFGVPLSIALARLTTHVLGRLCCLGKRPWKETR
jgi:hypothetical protein